MEKRVVFGSRWLPYALVLPQIAVTVVFFFWPAAQALWFAFLRQDAQGWILAAVEGPEGAVLRLDCLEAHAGFDGFAAWLRTRAPAAFSRAG